MKNYLVILVVLVIVGACKKREENPSISYPSAENIHIAEIIDSNITKDSLLLHQRFYYDNLGRINKIEGFGKYPSVQHWYYESDKLSKIEVASSIEPNAHIGTSFSRENQLIRSVSRGHDVLASFHFYYAYDAEGRLTQFIEKGADWLRGDTTFYSEFVNGRYTRSSKSFNLVFMEDSVPKKMLQKEQRSFDQVGRIVSLRQTLMGQPYYGPEPSLGLDSSGIETVYDYFPMSDLERKISIRQDEINRTYYSSNRDVLEQMLEPRLNFSTLYYAKVRKYSKGILFEQTTSIVESTNNLGLPTSILTTDPGVVISEGVEPRPFSQTRRTIRYEVD